MLKKEHDTEQIGSWVLCTGDPFLLRILLRAFGRRVSEISSMPGINPKSSDRNNMFAGQIGLDATSIWAAATSGAGAIAVHLLACMLSRMFTSSEATSI